MKYTPYAGSLARPIQDPVVRAAYVSHSHQVQRCRNPNNKDYKHSGAKGVRVEYSAREFITWWLEQYKLRPRWQSPTCGRIDHAGNYTFGNIRLEERADNSRERMTRVGNPSPPAVKIIAASNNGLILAFDSPEQALSVLGCDRELLLLHLSGKVGSPIPQLTFRYIRT